MRLKSYFASTVETAMKIARQELGSDAMLVSTKRTTSESAHLGEYEVVFGSATYPVLNASSAALASERPTPSAQPVPIARLSEEVAGLKREMERLASALARSSAGMARIAANPDIAEIFSRLVQSEFDAALAQDIVSRALSANDGSNLAAFTREVASELSRLLTVDSSLPVSAQKNAVALVGPPGAGKTTTLVKLAVLHALGGRRTCQILSLDTQRVAAAEQLRSYAAIAGLGFQCADTPHALALALEEHRTKELILIDTPGIGRDDVEDAADIAKFISTHPQIEPHLVLSASMKSADMNRITTMYEMFAPSKLIFTHLDETETFGGILNLAIRTGKPVSFISAGQQIPEDLTQADKELLVGMVLDVGRYRDDLLKSIAAA